MCLMSGKIIVIDGADGAGKATQVQMLVERLRNEGVTVETMDFPRYQENTFGKLLRNCLDGKHGDFMGVDARIASTLYAIDRYESKPKIAEWVSEGKTIVLDRYVSANMLHQGAKAGSVEELDDFLKWLDHVEHTILELPRPDIILYLDVPHSARQEMKQKAASEGKNGANGFVDLAEADSEHQKATEKRAQEIVSSRNDWVSINCFKGESLRSREEIHEEIYAMLHSKLNG